MFGTIRAEDTRDRHPQNQHKRAALTIIRSGADLGNHIFIEQRTIIGRDPRCSFPLHDHRVSRQHIAVTPLSDNRYLVEDLRSTNGTRVNGQPLNDPYVLCDGDKIAIGDSVMRFSLVDEMDISYQSEVAQLVGTDELTGLPSKRRFDESLEFALQSAVQTQTSLAVFMMDMDGLKKINDTHGHYFGAYAIGTAGKLIATSLAGSGQACRFGGDEFCAFVPHCDQSASLEIAEQIRNAIDHAEMQKDGIALHPTISIGVAVYPAAGSTLLELTQAADEALYRAKANGKNCVCV